MTTAPSFTWVLRYSPPSALPLSRYALAEPIVTGPLPDAHTTVPADATVALDRPTASGALPMPAGMPVASGAANRAAARTHAGGYALVVQRLRLGL